MKTQGQLDEPPILAADASERSTTSNYPSVFASRMEGRIRIRLGNHFGLTNFGVNMTRLQPGSSSSLRHSHSRQQEFIFILEGSPTLHTNNGYVELASGMCAGFRAGTGNGHRILNRSDRDVLYLEIGDRTSGDTVIYPDDDLMAVENNGRWDFFHKDTQPY